MNKKDFVNWMTISITCLVAMISDNYFDHKTRMVFLIIVIILCGLIISWYDNKTNIKRNIIVILSIGAVFMISLPIVKDPALAALNVITSFNTKPLVSSEELEKTVQKIDYIYRYLDIMTNEQRIKELINENFDNDEVRRILKKCEEWEAFPSNINSRGIEFFYKMQVSHETVYYGNVIRAFNEFGIDCSELNIDESKLLIWDLEYLYCVISMRSQLNADYEKGIKYNDISFLFNENKLNLQNYIDLCDYGSWRYNFSNYTFEEVYSELSYVIGIIYNKIKINLAQ